MRVEGGLLKHKGRLVIGSHGELREKLINEFHNTTLGGHSRVQVTYHMLKALFYWKGMKKEVKQFVRSFDNCQRNKIENIHPPGLLQPLAIPNQAWAQVSMEFIEGLPKSNNKYVIMVVVDRFTKYAHFISLAHPFSAKGVVNPYMENERMHMMTALKDNLRIAQQRMKHYADKNRSERSFVVGDWVYLKLQPYKQVTMAVIRNVKLSSKFYGPYEVLERVGQVAYKLKLPAGALIHPVFHISQLKRRVNRGRQAQLEPPKWANLSPDEATWEEYHHLMSQFPNFKP
ncbi:uncharacterized protein LOC116013193 [Ipomoea triloba]|uniref:uncharacterized protein LOC116013193 n=1 Tax=Ipomoea triloba TaxID=35885 RepID=UPI00125D3E1E|nr:uncharacterized protein LOC116013193 [Ipomoea triloba]